MAKFINLRIEEYGNFENAKSMKSLGLASHVVIQVTGLSKEEIEEL